MIFVTVGTTMPFDELLAEVDRLAAEGGLGGEEVLCQTGQSAYRMAHCAHFMARPSVADLIAASSLVVTHGGATVVQLLMAKRPFVAFPNPRGAGNHQEAFLRRVAAVADISWSADVSQLGPLVRERRALGAARVRGGFPRAADGIRDLLRGVRGGSGGRGA